MTKKNKDQDYRFNKDQSIVIQVLEIKKDHDTYKIVLGKTIEIDQ